MRCARFSSRADADAVLLNPPFDRSAQDPGYIKGYHLHRRMAASTRNAAVWIVMALARLGSGDEAAEFSTC